MNKFFKIIKPFLFVYLLQFSFVGNSQTSDMKMAQYYFDNADFEKAKMYYEKVYETDKSQNTYSKYLATLLELEEYKVAEKITKKAVKKNPTHFFYKISLGEIYEYQDKNDKAQDYFEDIIDDLDSETQSYKFSILSNEFIRISKLDYALRTLKKAEKHSKTKTNRFTYSIAYIYGLQGKTEEMIDSYLEVLQKNPTHGTQIKTRLSQSIDFETQPKKVKILRKKLLRKVQKNPDNEAFSDLIIWVFKMTDDYESAYIQVKAKDKRLKKKGESIYFFALQARSLKKYDIIIEALEYLVKDKNTRDYVRKNSKIQILKTLKEKITSNANYSQLNLKTLNSKYIATISEMKTAHSKIPLLQDLAHLQGFYLHNKDTAEIIIKSILNTRGISRKQKANNKIQLADIYMLKNEIWDASLLYMQVEKENKHDIIGSKAKYKNAKLYYYSGDFEWSQNQLEGLKASTSKLISNDAIDLSLLITDNYNMDTTPINMLRFAQADLLIFQNKFAEANLKLDTINKEAPAHSLNDEILFRRYEIAYKKQDFAESKVYLNEIMTEYSQDILADNAIFKLAELEENQLNNKKNAFELYGKIMFDYPGSLFVVEARKRYRKLNLDKKEINAIEKDNSKMPKKHMFENKIFPNTNPTNP